MAPVTAVHEDPRDGDAQAERLRIARRYPPPRHRRLTVAVVAVLALVLVVWTAWAGLHHSGQQVHAELHGYTVVSDSKVDAVVDVHRRDPSLPVRCTLYAVSAEHVRVGEIPLDVGPSSTTNTRVHASLRTFERAVTAQLEGCHIR